MEMFTPGTISRLNLGQYAGWTWDNTQAEPGKYTSNCRENKAGTIELAIYFPAIVEKYVLFSSQE